MTAHGFTAGPWVLSKRDDPEAPYSIISGAESGRAIAIAMCPRYRGDDWTADARLIAAAPRMYEAATAIDRLSLVILSAVRQEQPNDYEEVAAAIIALRDSLTAAATGSRG